MQKTTSFATHPDIEIDGKNYFFPTDWEAYLSDWLKMRNTANDLEEFSRNDSDSDGARSCYTRHRYYEMQYAQYWTPFQWDNKKSPIRKHYEGKFSSLLRKLDNEFFSLLNDKAPEKALEMLSDIKNEALFMANVSVLPKQEQSFLLKRAI